MTPEEIQAICVSTKATIVKALAEIGGGVDSTKKLTDKGVDVVTLHINRMLDAHPSWGNAEAKAAVAYLLVQFFHMDGTEALEWAENLMAGEA